MSNPVIHAFFLGRAFAEVLGEQLEDTLTNALSELGKFDAEQRENLRQFTAKVMVKAEQAQGEVNTTPSTATVATKSSPADLQQTIDELRAEIARMRTELKLYVTTKPI
ncbi:MAG: DUF6825 family protein [Spirulinaceae cyanobacterium]